MKRFLNNWPFSTCYACCRPLRNREHVPPRSFFPEKKDLPGGIDLRKDLITVPSCDIHNSDKSKDDEYLLFVIVSNYETNPVAQHHFSTKLMRAIRHRRSIATFFRNGQEIIVNGQPTWMYYPDQDRVNRTLKLISKAVYYHHFGKKWRTRLHLVVPPFLRIRALQSPKYEQKLRQVESTVLKWFKNEDIHGNNPEVFFYQIRTEESNGDRILRLVFYDFFSIIAIPEKPVQRARANLFSDA